MYYVQRYSSQLSVVRRLDDYAPYSRWFIKFEVCVFSDLRRRLASRRAAKSKASVRHRLYPEGLNGKNLVNQKLDATVRGGRDAVDALAAWLRSKYGGSRVLGVGHRVVHGGSRFKGPTILNPQVLAELYELVALAPLHQPYNLAAIEAASERLEGVPQVACFDTSFHRGQPAVAELIPLPRELREAGLQR